MQDTISKPLIQERTLINKLLIDEVVYMLFILGKQEESITSNGLLWEDIISYGKKNSGIYVINAPLGGVY